MSRRTWSALTSKASFAISQLWKARRICVPGCASIFDAKSEGGLRVFLLMEKGVARQHAQNDSRDNRTPVTPRLFPSCFADGFLHAGAMRQHSLSRRALVMGASLLVLMLALPPCARAADDEETRKGAQKDNAAEDKGKDKAKDKDKDKGKDKAKPAAPLTTD